MGKGNETTCEKKVDKMTECISLAGLKKLSQMKKDELPENWKILVLRYLQHKENWINNSKKISEYNIENLISAIDLARKLGVLWSVKRLKA